jgi:Flp pilus assembly pilin Flp
MLRAFFNRQYAGVVTCRTAVRDDHGQGVSEYALVMSMVILVTLVGLSFISSQVLDTLRKVAAALQ